MKSKLLNATPVGVTVGSDGDGKTHVAAVLVFIHAWIEVDPASATKTDFSSDLKVRASDLFQVEGEWRDGGKKAMMHMLDRRKKCRSGRK
jgi:hypothetical protein